MRNIEGKNRQSAAYENVYLNYISGKIALKSDSEILKTKYFFGNYEKEITPTGTRELNTIPGFDGNYALIELKNGQRNIFYVYTDHLGSTNVVTDGGGNPVERHNFDAWGRERR